MTNSSSLGRQDSNSEILELESISPNDKYSIVGISSESESQPIAQIESPLREERTVNSNPDLTRSTQLSSATNKLTEVDDSPRQPTIVTKSIIIDSTGEKLDIRAELDSILTSLKHPIPPPPKPTEEIDSISDTLAKIAAAEPIAHSQQLLVELQASRAQIADSQAELQLLHQRNQAQVDTVDHNVLQIKQLKFRTQQLARHSGNQLQKVQVMLASLEQIRAEIVTNLAKFGGYEEIHSMLVQLEDTRQALIIAHDRLKTGQEAFYESLRAIQEQVAFQSQDTEQKLHDYQESIQSLMAAITADRQQIAVMGVEMTIRLTEWQALNAEITKMHSQIVEKSQTLQASIAEIDRGFAQLAQSVQQEKAQFYELTVETIDKADAMRSQFADIARQIGLDREAIEQLKTEIESVRHNVDVESEQQIKHFDRQYQELMSNWSDLVVRQKTLTRHSGRFSTWLWILSLMVGVIFILLIMVLMSLK